MIGTQRNQKMIVLSIVFVILGIMFFVWMPALRQQSSQGAVSYEDAARTDRAHQLRMEEQSQPEWQQQFQRELDLQRIREQKPVARKAAAKVALED